MSVKNQSSRVVLLVVMVLGLLLASGVNVWPVVGPVAALLIIAAAMISIFSTRLPRHFIVMILGLLVGPFFFCYLFVTLVAMLSPICGSTYSRLVFLLVLFGLMAISFLHVRRQLTNFRNQRNELQTNERKPLLPVQAEPKSEVEQCVASSSYKES